MPIPMSVPSPCTNICEIDPASDLCRGCLRTLEEIASWGGMSDDEKRAVVARSKTRLTPSH